MNCAVIKFGQILFFGCVFGLFFLTGVGCQPPAAVESEHDHDHAAGHEHAATYAEALAKIKELRETVQNQFAAGTPADGDQALHEIGHILEDLPHLARDAGLSREDVITVKDAADRVFEAYGELDTAIHSGDEIPEGAYDEVAETIDTGIAELEAKLSMVDSDQAEERHDHADHAEEGHHDEADHDDDH